MDDLLPKILHNGELIRFEPEELRESIQKETHLIRQKAMEITKEVARWFVKSNIKITTKPMIREMTCAVMVTMGYYEERKCYTRIGISMYEAKAILESKDTIESKKDQIYEHIEYEFKGVRALKYE